MDNSVSTRPRASASRCLRKIKHSQDTEKSFDLRRQPQPRPLWRHIILLRSRKPPQIQNLTTDQFARNHRLCLRLLLTRVAVLHLQRRRPQRKQGRFQLSAKRHRIFRHRAIRTGNQVTYLSLRSTYKQFIVLLSF